MTEQPRRAGLIVNPRSGKGSGKGQALAEKLKGDPGISLHVLEHFAHLEDVIASMAQEQVTDLFISSGDGTIQEILTQIAERPLFSQQPRICLLPHGTILGQIAASLAHQPYWRWITALALEDGQQGRISKCLVRDHAAPFTVVMAQVKRRREAPLLYNLLSINLESLMIVVRRLFWRFIARS